MSSDIFFVDTHCHIQFDDYSLDPVGVLENARAAGVTQLIVIGCTLHDSQQGVDFANKHDGVFAAVGIHPHEAKHYVDDHSALQQLRSIADDSAVVAVGEIGLDFYYNNSDRASQEKMLRYQLDIAVELGLPVNFHVRNAFEEFWPIYDEYKVPGVIHCFSAGAKELNQILQRNLLVGLNGIATFAKNKEQIAAFTEVPLESMVLETDAPYLTPVPHRGKICEPKHVRDTATFLASLRSESVEQIAKMTTINAQKLFKL